MQVECSGADSLQPKPVVYWVTADGVAPNPPTLHIEAPSFKFEMCLANEVKLDTLKTQLHGQRIEIWFEKKVCMKWKSLHIGDKYKNEKTDPDLVMDSDPDDDDASLVDSRSSDPASSSAADMARAYHQGNAKKPTSSSKWNKPGLKFAVKWDVALLLYSWLLIFLCPYTKVEESFNMQAMHDIMFHQHNVESYDHLVFTGPVPRTMLGSVIVSTASSPITIILSLMNAPHWAYAYAARMVLASFLVASVSYLRFAVHKKYDADKSWWLGFVNLMQFHIPFYMSRSLPNTFALFFTNMALGCMLQHYYKYAIALLTASAVIFRSDTLVFAAPFVLSMLIRKNVTFSGFLLTGVATAIPCICCSVAVDSLFWQRLLWPEALVFLFNTVQNKSAEWGTSPWHWYFTSAIPRMLMAPALLLVFFIPYDLLKRINKVTKGQKYLKEESATGPKPFLPLTDFLLPTVAFVALYSLLPHKELRFILPSVAGFNVCTAYALSRLWELRMTFGSSSKNPWMKRVAELSVSLLIMNAMGIAALAYASYNNYPGGAALWKLHEQESSAVARSHSLSDPALVHVDVAAAQQGVSRFWQRDLEAGQLWKYSKQENITDFTSFHYCISETPALAGFSVIATANGFHPAMFFSNYTKPAIFVHKRLPAKNDEDYS